MARVSIPEVVLSASGGPVVNASVQVNVHGGSAATVYAAETGGTTVANPITTDAGGHINGWLAEGSYDLVVSGPGLTTYTQYFEANKAANLPPALSSAAGDMTYASAANTLARLAIGSAGTFLKVVTGLPVWTALSSSDLSGVIPPTGSIIDYAAATAPTGWLLCDGSAVSRTTQAALFAVIGTTYGVGDGSTTFNVPDLRGRVPVGYAASGGHADVSTLGNSDGVTAANRRPKHRHTAHSHTDFGASGPHFAAGGGGGSTTLDGTGTTSSVDGGSGNANDSLDAPAYLVLNKIIKT